ncbi:MAG: shikimate dehydrogenase [Eggerthellaceae bacterium]
MNSPSVPISGKTHLVSMIGSPVSHSVSPATHSLAYKKLGIDAVFLVFDIGNEDLPAVMSAFRAMDGWDSTTVTMPCKQAIIPFLDDLSPEAKLSGAVNVVKKEVDGRIVGYNADGAGFMNNLINHHVKIAGSTMTLLGPGGAGSAILAQAALDGVTRIDAFARKGGSSYTEAFALKERIERATSCKVNIYPFEDEAQLKRSIEESDILANCTNVGMGNGNTDTPIPSSLIKPGMGVAEVINTPRETQLLKEAKKLGCRTFGGLGMNDQQAVVADKIRFDIEIPIEEIRAELSSE